jgi:hypothetical protein
MPAGSTGALVPAMPEQQTFERPKKALSAEFATMQRESLFSAFDEIPHELGNIIIFHIREYDLAPTVHSEYTEQLGDKLIFYCGNVHNGHHSCN